jgi:hypothetical protein
VIDIDDTATYPKEREQIVNLQPGDGVSVFEKVIPVPFQCTARPRLQQPDGPQVVDKCRGHRPPAPPPNYPACRYAHRNPTAGIYQRRQDLAGVERKGEHPKPALRLIVLVRSLPRQHHTPALIEQDDARIFWLAYRPGQTAARFGEAPSTPP